MKFFNRSIMKAPGAGSDEPGKVHKDVQREPISVVVADGSRAATLKVDLAIRLGSSALVAGWRTEPIELALHSGKEPLPTRLVSTERPDVARHFNLPSAKGLGFVLVAEVTDGNGLILTCPGADDLSSKGYPLRVEGRTTLDSSEQTLLGPALGSLITASSSHSEAWNAIAPLLPVTASPCRRAKGCLEMAAACDITGHAVVSGWLVRLPGVISWIEDEKGRAFPVRGGYRRFRQDVHDAVGQEFVHVTRSAGFIVKLDGIEPGARLCLKVADGGNAHVLGEVAASTLPADPVAASRLLFGLGGDLYDFHRRVSGVDHAIIDALIANRQASWGSVPVRARCLGVQVPTPKVSIVVPLYGRSDFVEHQLIELAKDRWFKENAELIYVVDDPQLAGRFIAEAETLHRLYRIPFCWVWGSVNRGFSGANNLGAAHSRGEHLVFLNSDAFPQRPGWLQALVEVLEARPDIGAVGPRLVFADGSIQHAGIAFARREDLGVWINHHPCMGLDPSLDPNKELTEVQCITGACLAMRRVDLERIGGWDAGYLIGDFEDSDLCFKLRSEGFKIAYLPTVQLTHLERQSFKLLGQSDYRTRVVIYNAVRHQQRWGQLIETTAAATE